MNPLARLELERAKVQWDELEVAALRRLWPDVKAIEQETARTYAAVKAKGARLGLRLTQDKEGAAR